MVISIKSWYTQIIKFHRQLAGLIFNILATFPSRKEKLKICSFSSLFSIKNLSFLECFFSVKFALWSPSGISDYFLWVVLVGRLFVTRVTHCLEWQPAVQRFPLCPSHLHSLCAPEIWRQRVTAARPSPPRTTAHCLSATHSRVSIKGGSIWPSSSPSQVSAWGQRVGG